jgi:hypothetical protein
VPDRGTATALDRDRDGALARRKRFVIAIALLCVALAPLQADQGGFDRALELVRAGDARAALAAADAETDALRRAQARVYVLEQAGDLEGALAEARAGAAAHADDPWIAGRLCAIGAMLRRMDAVEAAERRLARLAAREPEAAGEAVELAAGAREELALLRAAHERSDAAVVRARAVSIALLALCALALGWLAFASRRARAGDPG